MATLREMITQAIDEAGISRQSVAESAGMTRGNLYRWLNGQRDSLSSSTVDRIVQAIEEATGRKLRFSTRRETRKNDGAEA